MPGGEFKDNLSAALSGLLGREYVRILLMGIVPTIDRLTSPYKEDKYIRRADVERYESILEDVSVHLLEPRLIFVPIARKWAESGDPYIEERVSDGVHPNDLGHDTIAAQALQALHG